MSTSKQILQEALALPLEEKVHLIEQLLATFQAPPDPALDQLWANEAHDRLDAYDRGELDSVDIEEIFEQNDKRDT